MSLQIRNILCSTDEILPQHKISFSETSHLFSTQTTLSLEHNAMGSYICIISLIAIITLILPAYRYGHSNLAL